jgi:hypothetical protein
MSKIEAIKYLKAETKMGLGDAKKVFEHLETIHLSTLQTPQMRELKEAQDRAACYQEDMHALIRMVDYFVAHPAEYEAWKQERPLLSVHPADGRGE